MQRLKRGLTILMFRAVAYVLLVIFLIVAVTGVFYAPLTFEGLMTLLAIWTGLGILVGERMPQEMSWQDYLKSEEGFAPAFLFFCVFTVLLAIYGIRETAAENPLPLFTWKKSEMYGFLVVGIGAYLSGILMDYLLRRKGRQKE